MTMKRTYVACAPCRKRKVKCEIGEGPPCAKCHREHRKCVFHNTQKAPKRREAPSWAHQESLGSPSNSRSSPSASRSPLAISDRANTQPAIQNNLAAPSSELQHGAASSSWQDDQVMSAVMTQPRHALEALFTAARPEQNVVPSRQLDPGSARPAFDLDLGPRLSAPSPLSIVPDSVLDSWDKFRFVRQGWFTAQEAVTYVDLFFQNLAPLCPLTLDRWKDHASHEALITEEAMLCATILAISSRFHILAGPGGYTRGHHIHSKLWSYCERLIQRLMMGQEKTSSARIRSLGTIEALILISDWQPRAIHFPPETDGWDVSFLPNSWDKNDRTAQDGGTSFVRWQEDVFEPAKRSDRMSWMLLGAANNLLLELGLNAEDHQDKQRFQYTRTALEVYATQLATRLHIPSFLSPQLAEDTPSVILPNDHDTSAQRCWKLLMSRWTELIALEKTAATIFFRSASHVNKAISEGRYTDVIRHFMSPLREWETSVDQCPEIPTIIIRLLKIQFYHLRILVRAISLQAVVNRMSTMTVLHDLAQVNHASTSDQLAIRELVDDCHALLNTAADLAGFGILRYAPLRILINITSASVFLLKAISIGSRVAELKQSLEILDKAIGVLKSSPVDDMDFAARYASLIEKHVNRFRINFKASYNTRTNSPTHANMETSNTTDTGGGQIALHEQGIQDMSFEEAISGLDPELLMDEWFSQPFDPAVAPFSNSADHIAWGLNIDSLDFLWNLPCD